MKIFVYSATIGAILAAITTIILAHVLTITA